VIVGDDVERIDEEIVDRYPYPLVATYDRAFFQAPDPAEAHEYLLDLFEVTLKYFASIAISQYFHDHARDPKINRDLLEIQRPSLGHWHGWLRDILALYRRDGRTLVIPELDVFYRQKHDGAILSASQSLSRIMATMGYGASIGDPSGVSTQQFFELLVGYRNRLAHGARPSTHDRAAVADLLLPALRQLYTQMGVIAEYRLVYIRTVTLEFEQEGRHRYRHVVTYLTGQTPRAAPNPTLLDEPYPDKQLYVLDRTSEFRPLLSLHPFFIFAHCASCNREQTFVLNMSDASSQDYLGYQCTHHFSPTEYLDYMRRLLDELGVARADAPAVVPAGNGRATVPVEPTGPPPPPPPPPWKGSETEVEPVPVPPPPRSRRSRFGLFAGIGAAAAAALIVLIIVLSRGPGGVTHTGNGGSTPTPSGSAHPATPPAQIDLSSVVVSSADDPNAVNASPEDATANRDLSGTNGLICTPSHVSNPAYPASKSRYATSSYHVLTVVAQSAPGDAQAYMTALAASIQQCGLGQSVSRVGDDTKGIVYGPTQPGSGNNYGAVMFVRSGNLVGYVSGIASQYSSLPDVTTIASAMAARMAQVQQ
jgi:hypothetical protein